jgi:hypothetical protein
MKEHEGNMENEILTAKKLEYWRAQTEAAHRLESRGIEELIADLEPSERRELFKRANGLLGCMDEGCEKCGFRVAGSGMLIAPEDQAAFLENCRKMGVTEVTHHEGCGAAGVYAKRIKSDSDPAELAIEYSGGAAEKLDLSNSYIPATTMGRPKEFHSTRFAYYDGTDNGLNLEAAPGTLPNGFVLTRQLYPKTEYAAAEAQLAFDIAVGHHGFGELITEDEPFVIIVVADQRNPEMSLDKLMSELEPLSHNTKIMITGFIAPSEEAAVQEAA